MNIPSFSIGLVILLVLAYFAGKRGWLSFIPGL